METNRIDYERIGKIRRERLRKLPSSKKEAITTMSVDLSLIQDYLREAKSQNFTFRCDEMERTGGTDTAPEPLAYFLAGAGLCEMSMWVSASVDLGIRLTSVEMKVTGIFDRRLFFDRARSGFTKIIFESHIQSKESKERIARLADVVERRCPAFNNLRFTSDVSNKVWLNNTEIQ